MPTTTKHRSNNDTPQGNLRGYFFNYFTVLIQLFHGLTQLNKTQQP